jgi:hypothetical protein
MNGHGFTSVFADDLERYLAFKESMGYYGNSRIWYLRNFDRALLRATRAWFQRCRWPISYGALPDLVKRLPGNPVLSAERADRAPRRIRRPLRDSEADTRINRFTRAHPSNIEEKCHHQTRD